MIFITVGSQKFQFNRLLKEVDRLVGNNTIKEEVFAQTGYSDYRPKNYKYKDFLDRDEFSSFMTKCDKVITHGGTGAIIGAVKQGKKVIAVARLKKFDEHVDDHQLDIVNQFSQMKLIKGITDINKLGDEISKIEKEGFLKYRSNTINLIRDIELHI